MICFFAVSQRDVLFASSCSEILKHPLDRHRQKVVEEIFKQGDELLMDYFDHNDFYSLQKEEKELFVFKNKKKIIEQLIHQGTILRLVGDKKFFVVRGGETRLGRVAAALNKKGISLILDLELLLKINAAGFYTPKRHFIILGLEDALYPNQLSLNLFHEAMHASLDTKALFIPRIYDENESKSYEDFSIDELLTYSKQIRQMINSAVQSQNSESASKRRNDKILEAIRIYKELCRRTLAKKNELLKVVDYLKQVEVDPFMLKFRFNRFILEGLDPQIYLFRSGFTEYFSDQVTKELLDDDPSIQFKIFQGSSESYKIYITQRARVSQEIILNALKLAESVSQGGAGVE